MSAGVEIPFDAGRGPSRALVYRANGASRACVVLAPGAGGHQLHPWIVAMAGALTARDVDVVTFDFAYRHAGRRLPDKNDALEAAWVAALAVARAQRSLRTDRMVIGGKSMGGRIATQVAARGAAGDLAGIVLFGYPLHPPGKATPLRSAHLPEVRVPMLFVQGSRDAFGRPDELRPVLAKTASSRLFVVDGAEHGLAPPRSRKAGDASLEPFVGRLADEVGGFLDSLGSPIASP